MPISSYLGVPVVMLSQIGMKQLPPPLSTPVPASGIYIDCVDEVTVIEDAKVTEHPTETGANVSDAIINLPVRITMSGRFSNAPLATFGIDMPNPAASGINQLSNPTAALVGGLSVASWKRLEALRTLRNVFAVVIQQGTYNNMAIVSLGAPRGKGDGNSMQFQIEMKQTIITSALISTASNLSASADPSAAGVSSGGVQTTTLLHTP